MASEPRTPSSPVTDDTFVIRRSADADDKGRFADRIERYLKTLYATGEDAEERHKRALEELRRDGGEAVIALAKAEAGCQRGDYPRRWALVYAATRLSHDAALPYLRELVLTPIPSPKVRDAHAFSVAREETILRTTAIEGVGRLARNGNKRALEALLGFLEIPSISVCRASIQAILSAEPGYRDQIAERIPRGFRHLLDVRPAQVTTVPQVKDPKKHLRIKKPLAKPLPPDLTPIPSGRPAKRPAPKLRRK
jgi:hypothetical protein